MFCVKNPCQVMPLNTNYFDDSTYNQKDKFMFLSLFDHRYLIDTRWFKQWQRYVGYNIRFQETGQKSGNPGPIDNSNLFMGKFSLCNKSQRHVFQLDGLIQVDLLYSKFVN